MNKYDILEVCLKEIENGASLEAVLARYPDQAGKLRPILKASIQARRMAASDPSPEVIRTGRAKLMQHAAELRGGRKSPLRKRVIPVFQRLALSFSLTAVFLLSGTGLVGASSSALPGENLYPVKRTWEDVRLLFVFDSDAHDALQSHFENERLNEVSELLAEGRDETIQFAGIYTLIDDTTYISNLPVVISAKTQLPAQGLEDGVLVSVSGYTNANGVVEIDSITLLPPGSFVPAGRSVDADTSPDENSKPPSAPDTESGGETGTKPSGKSQEKTSSETHYFEAEGLVESFSDSTLVINGKTVYFDNVKITGELRTGARVEIKGYYASDGRFMVTAISVKNLKPDNNSGKTNPDSNTGNSESNHETGSHSHEEHDHEH